MKLLVPPSGTRSVLLRFSFLSIALIAIAVLAACGRPGQPDEEPAAMPEPPSQAGPREITVSGNLAFPNTELLSFESPGVVGDIMVNEGDRVQAGQELASLDTQTVSQLSAAVAGAQLAVTSADNNLAALQLEPNIQIANAELEVASAEVALDEARDALENLTQRPGVNMAGAELAVAQAQVALDNAEERLEDLLVPEDLAVSSAESRVAAARVELDAAQEAYNDIEDGVFPDDVVRDARNRMNFALTALEAANRNRSDALAAAHNALTQAEDAEFQVRERYRAAFKYWFGSELTDDELKMTADEVIESWGIDLDETFKRFNPEYGTLEPTPDNPATRWNELTIWAWINLSLDFSTIVPTCSDDDVLGGRQVCITRELQTAYDGYDQVVDALEAARNNAATINEQTEDAVAGAQAALTDAQDDLGDVEGGPDASIVENAEKRLRLAEVSLREAEDDLAELTVDIDPLNIQLARAAVNQAEVGLEEAEDTLERASDDGLLIAAAERRVNLAEAALSDAESNLDTVRDLVDRQIAIAEAELSVAQANFDDAQESLAGAIITSPLAGVITVINVETDEVVGEDLPAITVVANDVVEVQGVIDAAGRPYVSEGASAVVNIDSIGDTALGGSVSHIGSEARTERGVVSYAVRIRVDVPAGVTVPVSLSAASAVITGSGAALNIDGASDTLPMVRIAANN
ncbi:MAG: HlyD family efflux transporter periplasmic adaptor subunit [Chloroflexi bacterium]|nr:HlyD family efflux transporter periplasmic adaptor subunit [Chloroflexota bacterium]